MVLMSIQIDLGMSMIASLSWGEPTQFDLKLIRLSERECSGPIDYS